MKIKFFLIILTFLMTTATFFYIYYLNKRIASLRKKEISLLIVTQNCEESIEAIIRYINKFILFSSSFEIVVVDRYSVDETYSILKYLAKEYNFLLFQKGPDEVTACIEGKKRCTGKVKHIFTIDDKTSLKKIKKRLQNIKKTTWKKAPYNKAL